MKAEKTIKIAQTVFGRHIIYQEYDQPEWPGLGWFDPCWLDLIDVKGGQVPYFTPIRVFTDFILNESVPAFDSRHIVHTYLPSPHICEGYKNALAELERQAMVKRANIIDPKSPEGKGILHPFSRKQ